MKIKVREAIVVSINGRDRIFYRRENLKGIRGTYYVDKNKHFILKLDGTNECDAQCEQEAENWQRLKETPHARHFAPILAAGKNPRPWVLMPFIKKSPNKKGNTRKVLTTIRRKYKGIGMDLYPGNYIVTENGPIIVDYGFSSLDDD